MKSLKKILAKKSGRDSTGHVSVRHQGGRQKRFLREIDFKRDKKDIWGEVVTIEYDPNRNTSISLILYEDGEYRYILTPDGLKVGQKIVSAPGAPLKPGNSLPLEKIRAGTLIHNLEITPGKGGQLVKSAGGMAVVQGKEDDGSILVKLPSGEIRRFKAQAYATVGQIGNLEERSKIIGKAGVNRRRGRRPTVRGVAQHPNSHPHGGGEGRSGVGLKYPKTVYGRKAVGKTRRKGKYSDRLIIKPRKKGAHS